MATEPWLTWHFQAIGSWVDEFDSLEELHEHLEEMRIGVKEATNYRFDNSHYIIKDIFGKPALSFNISDDHMSFWNAQNKRAIGRIEELTADSISKVQDWVREIAEDKQRCNECGEWVEEYNTYSFAGAVCDNCYDPEAHKPPRTV